MKYVITGRYKNKDHNNNLYKQAVKSGNTLVFCRKSSCSYRSKGVADSIEYSHSSKPEQGNHYSSKREVYNPQYFCRLSYARLYLVRCKIRRFSAEQFVSSNANIRKNCDKENNDTHSSKPLCHAPPEKDTMRQCLDIAENGCTCGSEPAH